MGTVSQASLNMKAFVIVALVAAVAGEADPYTIGQVLAGQTNGGVLTSTTYHGGVKVAGFPYTAVAAPVVSHAYAGWSPPLRRRPRHQPRPRRRPHCRRTHPLLQRRHLHQLRRCRRPLLIVGLSLPTNKYGQPG